MIFSRRNRVCIALTAALWVALGSTANAGAPPKDCGRGWVFFDLGMTLVDNSNPKQTLYMEGALDYVQKLRVAGFHLALISNVPDSWGTTVEAKLVTLKSFISQSWAEPEAFVWQDFEAVLLPPSDPQRKPDPFLFLQARKLGEGCKIAYEGDDTLEIDAARAAGFDQGYVVGKTSPDEFFLSPDRIFQSP